RPAEVLALRGSDGDGEPDVLRRGLRSRRAAARGKARLGNPAHVDRAVRRPAGRAALGRLEAAPRARRSPDARAPRAVLRRADRGNRSGGAARAVEPPFHAGRPRGDASRQHALHGRGGAVRPRRAAGRGGGVRMRGFRAVLRKEAMQMLRDRGTLQFALMVPAMQLVLFGLIDTNVRHVPTVVFDQSRTEESRRLVSEFVNTSLFDVNRYANSRASLREEIV